MSAISGRSAAVHAAQAWFDRGELASVLARRVAYRTESQRDDSRRDLVAYLADEIAPSLARIGFTSRIVDNPAGGGPFLIAERIEDPSLPTVLTYGHGDVILGYDAQWREGLSPWTLTPDGDRWYGRGTADNKGQHTINFAALERVIEARGRLGFNVKVLLETGEETGSPGLREICIAEREALAADVLIASDGPRLRAAQPTLFLGSRGAFNFDMTSSSAAADTIRATGAACSPIPERSSRTRSRRWSMRAGAFWSTVCGRLRYPPRFARRLQASIPASRAALRSTRRGESRVSRRPSACSHGTRSRCSHSSRAIPLIR